MKTVEVKCIKEAENIFSKLSRSKEHDIALIAEGLKHFYLRGKEHGFKLRKVNKEK